jgi:peptidoglycan L-alanyl-D-glutamate endopeptidase CwlK
MSLVNEQWAFLQDVARLLAYIAEQGLVATGGELWRSPEQQEIYLSTGRSKTRNSYHLKRLAIDLNFIEGGQLAECPEHVGAYWESLTPEVNVWGGRWQSPYDPGHFERRV